MFEWKYKEFPEESIITPARSDNSFIPKLTYIHNSKVAVKFERNCLKNKVSFTHRTIANFLVFKN